MVEAAKRGSAPGRCGSRHEHYRLLLENVRATDNLYFLAQKLATGDVPESIRQGLAVAQYNLGVSYERGEGVGQDWEEAVKWYRLAADQGYDRAMDRLSSLEANAGPSGRPTNPGELPCVYSDVFGNE